MVLPLSRLHDVRGERKALLRVYPRLCLERGDKQEGLS